MIITLRRYLKIAWLLIKAGASILAFGGIFIDPNTGRFERSPYYTGWRSCYPQELDQATDDYLALTVLSVLTFVGLMAHLRRLHP